MGKSAALASGPTRAKQERSTSGAMFHFRENSMPRFRLVVMLAVAVAGLVTQDGILHRGRAFAQATVQTQPIDPFGQQITLTPKTIVYASGAGTWDKAFDSLVEAFKTVQAYVEKEGLKPTGPAMTVYTAIDDTGFNFQAAIPVAEAPKTPPQGGLAVGTSPEGKALKFVHRGSFESTVSTYDTISHFLEEKQLDSKDVLIEEYTTDLVTTPEDKLVINIFVPIE
jgi:effector-binding domain-containing protein